MNEEVYEAAAAWHEAQRQEPFDWDAFATWLEVDDHRRAYDQIALLDDRIDRAAPDLAPLLDRGSAPWPVRRRRPVIWGGAAAACAAVIAAVGIERRQGAHDPATRLYVAASTDRTVAIAQGSTATLSPGSRLRIAGEDVALDGRASFVVRHDPSREMVVHAGDYAIRDVGTRFEVVSGAGMLRVSVAAGEVAVSAVGVARETRVAAGRSLTALASNLPLELGAPMTPPADGGPKAGLSYEAMPMGLVAADLSRHTGASFEVDPDVARERFTGTIRPADAQAMATALAQLSGLEIRKTRNAIRLVRSAGG